MFQSAYTYAYKGCLNIIHKTHENWDRQEDDCSTLK